jgi:hypothetical protein
VREEGRNDVWDGFVEDLDTITVSTLQEFAERTLTATMDIPSTQNWKAMKTMSRKMLNTAVPGQTGSAVLTFSFGVVQSITMRQKHCGSL